MSATSNETGSEKNKVIKADNNNAKTGKVSKAMTNSLSKRSHTMKSFF
jgi:hypothetical protein